MTADEKMIAISEIARLIGKHKSVVHRVANRLGIASTQMRSSAHRGQVAHFVTQQDFHRIKLALSGGAVIEEATLSESASGVLYVIQLEPDFDPGRFKVGFATDVEQRLRAHRTAAPMARLLKTWPCKLLWEKTAIDCITQDCESLHTEVFRCNDLARVLAQADRFFSLMPRNPKTQ